MANYCCKRCGYASPIKGNLVAHLKRKNACDSKHEDIDRNTLIAELKPQKSFRCTKCSREFSSRQNKWRHEQECKDAMIDQLLKKVDDLEKRVSVGCVTNNTVNNVYNQQNNNITVQLRDFGCENMNALPKSLIETLFLDLRFKELLENLHCDPQYPENHNVRIKSTKRRLIEIYRNNKWDIMTFVNGLNELLLQGHGIFKEYYKKNRERILDEDMDEKDLQELLRRLEDIERLNEDEVKLIRQDIQLMLESSRNQLAN